MAYDQGSIALVFAICSPGMVGDMQLMVPATFPDFACLADVRPSASTPRRHSTVKRTKTKDLDVQIEKPFVGFSIISFMWVKYLELQCINSEC